MAELLLLGGVLHCLNKLKPLCLPFAPGTSDERQIGPLISEVVFLQPNPCPTWKGAFSPSVSATSVSPSFASNLQDWRASFLKIRVSLSECAFHSTFSKDVMYCFCY